MSLCIEDLHYAYPGRPLFKGLSLRFDSPGLYWIEGGNGCGKTSLLRLIAGELQPRSGRILLHGQPLAAAQCAWLPAQLEVFDMLSPRQLLDLNADLPGVDRAAAAKLAADFGLDAVFDLPWRKLSLGTRRKVLLAAHLARPQALLLLDEPANALDVVARGVLAQALTRLAGSRLILLSAHEHQGLDELGPRPSLRLPQAEWHHSATAQA